MYIVLLPVWLLALPVTWRRSARLPKSYRIALLICVTIGMGALAEGLGLWITAEMLSSSGDVQHAHRVYILSWVAFSMSIASFAVLAFFAIRGSFIMKHRERSNQLMQPTAGRSEGNL